MQAFRRTSHFNGFLVSLCVLAALPWLSLAQDASPAANDMPHPVHVHEGTCDDLEPAPLYPLNDITNPGAADVMTGSPIVVETSVTTIEAPFSELIGGNLAINVHESEANIGNYIACGDIGGTVVTDEQGESLSIGLGQLNNSGYAGVAVLNPIEDRTTITIYLANGLFNGTSIGNADGEMDGVTHESHESAVQVEISGFAYTPAEITISAGESVTWTNLDSAPHTVTAQDRDALQSGTMEQGDTYTQTFDTPGTYEYFCEFHPDMMGVVIVE